MIENQLTSYGHAWQRSVKTQVSRGILVYIWRLEGGEDMILHGWKLCERISESFNNIEARISQEPLVNKWPVPRGDRTSWLCNFFSNLTTIVAHKFWNQSKIMLQMDNKNKRTISGVCVQMNYYFFPLKFPKVQRSLPMS